jgi:hypothetical protein
VVFSNHTSGRLLYILNSQLKEYAAWKKENEAFYQQLEDHNAVLYDRFLPVYAVLEHMYTNISNGMMEFDEDMEKIFTIGLEFIHDQFQLCKLYLQNTFSNDFHAFYEYDSVFSMLFYVEDVRYELVEAELGYDEELLEEIVSQLEEIIEEKKPIQDTLGIYVDDVLQKVIGDASFEFYGIIDIFMEVADVFGITLFETEDVILGTDL